MTETGDAAPVTVTLTCGAGRDGTDRVQECVLESAEMVHRITPDTGPDLPVDLPGGCPAGATRDPQGGTVLAGQPVTALGWLDGPVPRLRFTARADGLDAILGHHFGILRNVGPLGRYPALRTYETVILPTVNLATASRQMGGPLSAQRGLHTQARSLARRCAAMKLALDRNGTPPGQTPPEAGDPVPTPPPDTARPRGTAMILHLCEAPDDAAGWRPHSATLHRHGARHGLIFGTARCLGQTLGAKLGALVQRLAADAGATRPVHDLSALDYWEAGFAARGAQVRVIDDGQAAAPREVAVELRQTTGLPHALRAAVPWPVPLSHAGATAAGSLHLHVGLALDAAGDLLETLMSAHAQALDGQWLRHQADFLWLLANMIGRNLDQTDAHAAQEAVREAM